MERYDARARRWEIAGYVLSLVIVIACFPVSLLIVLCEWRADVAVQRRNEARRQAEEARREAAKVVPIRARSIPRQSANE